MRATEDMSIRASIVQLAEVLVCLLLTVSFVWIHPLRHLSGDQVVTHRRAFQYKLEKKFTCALPNHSDENEIKGKSRKANYDRLVL